ncbi:MAG: cobalamin-binding protein [Bacteroidota bacterium]
MISALSIRRTPERIVCLTEEPTEILYLLGEAERIVGITAYTERPAHAKKEKPVVSAFVGGSVERIKALKPDLVIGFSDVQADYANKLIKENLQVVIFNQRSIAEILQVILMIGRLVGANDRAEALVDTYVARINTFKANTPAVRPRVYFEEWDDPKISAIQWVSELISLAGGENIFANRAAGAASAARHVTSQEVIAANPDLFIGCWCGKKLDHDAVYARPGWQNIAAIQNKQVHEMDPAIILQPGPACLTDGLDALASLIAGATPESS